MAYNSSYKYYENISGKIHWLIWWPIIPEMLRVKTKGSCGSGREVLMIIIENLFRDSF